MTDQEPNLPVKVDEVIHGELSAREKDSALLTHVQDVIRPLAKDSPSELELLERMDHAIKSAAGYGGTTGEEIRGRWYAGFYAFLHKARPGPPDYE